MGRILGANFEVALPHSAPTLDAVFDQLAPEQLGAGAGECIRAPEGSAVDTLYRLPEIPMEPEPKVKGGFQVKETLGRGGMGAVQRAYQPRLNRDIAVKRVTAEAGPAAARALIREARIVGRLEHPNIVPVHDLGLDPHTGQPVLSMKYIQGTPWERMVDNDRSPLWEPWSVTDPLERNISVLIEVCRATHFAHTQGVLHRDIKPSNVMLGPHGEVHLLDWGAACDVDDMVSAKHMVGTPAYMPPELLGPDRLATVRADVFLLGACLCRVLTGAPPHPGRGSREALIAAAAWAGPTLDPATGALGEICAKATAPEPSARHRSARDLQLDLEGWLARRGAARVNEATRRSLAELKEALAADIPEPRRIAVALAECRFGFQQALDLSPDFSEAKTGLEEALVAVLDWELDRRQLLAAEQLLSELERLGVEAQPQAARLWALEEKERTHVARAKQLDLETGRSQRARRFAAISVVGFLLAGGLFGGIDAAGKAITHRELVIFGVVFNLVLIGGLAVARGWLVESRINRSLASAIIATGLAIEAMRLLAWHTEMDLAALLTMECLLIAVPCAILGPFMGRGMFVLGGAWLLAAVGAVLMPDAAMGMQIVGYSLSGAFAVLAAVRTQPQKTQAA